MRTIRRTSRRIAIAAALAGALFAAIAMGVHVAPAQAKAAGLWSFSSACPDILVIGARGSGQERDARGSFTDATSTLGLGAEVFGLYQQLADALGSLTVAALPNPYPAIPLDQYRTYDIFNSVDLGATNTRVLVAGVVHKCGDKTRIVLAGYSQGAWVAKDGAAAVTGEDQRHIAALALLADPTFDPNGGGTLVGTFDSAKGGIAFRKPVPDYIKRNTVSACLAHDLVCQGGSTFDLLRDAIVFGTRIHTTGYQDPRLLSRLANVVASRFRSSAVDLVFVIDATGSMGPYIGGVKSAASGIVDTLLSGSNARIGVVDYKDLYAGCPSDGYASRTDIGFSADKAAIESAIKSLSASGGCDLPESVYSGLIRAIQFPWRSGVKKEIVLMGDAPPHDPELVTGYRLASVVAAAKAVDPAAIFSVDINGGATPFFNDLSSETGGSHTVVSDPSSAVDAILESIHMIFQAPVADAGGPYAGNAGIPILFDASGSFSPSGAITKYEWDFNDDGTVDATTTAPTVSHSYSAAYHGLVGLRVTDDSSPAQTATGTATVSISADTIPPTVACKASPATLWPPNHKLVPVSVSVAVTDSGSGPAGYTLIGATSSESGGSADIQGFRAGTNATTGLLRAVRAGHGPGRVYTLTYQGRDKAGNAARCDVKIVVPHNR